VVFCIESFRTHPRLVAHAVRLGTAIPTCVIVSLIIERVRIPPAAQRAAPGSRHHSDRRSIVLQTIAMLSGPQTT